jgi:hypothetical protein
MILGLIFSILTATYTLSSTTTVESSGNIPQNSTFHYERSATTGQKGQMTAGNSTTLLLSGWDGCTIKSVVLSMRSNKAAGAGSMQMYIGNRIVWEIENSKFSDHTWYGSFTIDVVDIPCSMNEKVGNGEDISIHITASENSLYINSYTISYTLPAPEAHEVRFVSGLGETPQSLTEDFIGSGVVLPTGVDTLEWHFLGWSEQEIVADSKCPPLLYANERYFPTADCTLWAVYSDSEGVYSTDNGISGDYVMASSFWQTAVIGKITNGEMQTKPISLEKEEDYYTLLTGIDDNMIYHIDFLPDSTLTIRHKMTDRLIGYNGNKLAERESYWQYRLLLDGSFGLYYHDEQHDRMFFIMDDVARAHLIDLSSMNENGVILFPAERISFTSWPFGKFDSVENIFHPTNDTTNGTYQMYFGNYVLHIQNGQKRMVIGK